MGTFYPLLDTPTKLVGVEAGGKGLGTGQHSASIGAGTEGVFHGMLTYVLQDEYGQIKETHSISAGLDYPGVGPEHSFLHVEKRVDYVSVTDDEAAKAFLELSRAEGILPALEPSHAVAHAMKMAKRMKKDESLVVTLSGRGDKDVGIIADYLGENI